MSVPAPPSLVIGTAGWTVPKQVAEQFPYGPSALARYAGRFSGAEINTTFYRPHKPETYRRWAATVPAHFRFAVKAPKTITHERRLVEAGNLFARFVDEIAELGGKVGPLLFQLPPKLDFDAATAAAFFGSARRIWDGPIILEPRHVTWFGEDANRLLVDLRISRAGADPLRAPDGDRPGGEPGICYLRLHGSPRVYFSSYTDEQLAAVRDIILASAAAEKWCVFDNTASGAAAADALRLMALPGMS